MATPGRLPEVGGYLRQKTGPPALICNLLCPSEPNQTCKQCMCTHESFQHKPGMWHTAHTHLPSPGLVLLVLRWVLSCSHLFIIN